MHHVGRDPRSRQQQPRFQGHYEVRDQVHWGVASPWMQTYVISILSIRLSVKCFSEDDLNTMECLSFMDTRLRMMYVRYSVLHDNRGRNVVLRVFVRTF